MISNGWNIYERDWQSLLCYYNLLLAKGSSYQLKKWLTWIPSIRSKDPGPEQIFCKQDLCLANPRLSKGLFFCLGASRFAEPVSITGMWEIYSLGQNINGKGEFTWKASFSFFRITKEIQHKPPSKTKTQNLYWGWHCRLPNDRCPCCLGRDCCF